MKAVRTKDTKEWLFWHPSDEYWCVSKVPVIENEGMWAKALIKVNPLTNEGSEVELVDVVVIPEEEYYKLKNYYDWRDAL